MFEPHFGLRENPFSTGHDPRFVYPSPEHLEAVAHFRYGIQNREAFVLVTGEVGTGKTTAIYDLVSRLPQQAHVALINNSALTRIELLEEIARRFGVEPPATPSKPALLSALELRLSAHNGHGEPCILIVDEAQNLSNDLLEEIRLLSNLDDRGGHLMHICLVGQPELEEKLARPELRQLRQRISVKYRLNPLSAEECVRYIHHRLRVAGGEPERIFPEDSAHAVHQLTHGIPREINIVASQAMVNAYVDGTRPVRPEHVRAVSDEFSFRSVLGASTEPEAPLAQPAPKVEAPRVAPPPARVAPPPPPARVAPPIQRPASPPEISMAPVPRPPLARPAPRPMPAPVAPPALAAPPEPANATVEAAQPSQRTVSNWRERRTPETLREPAPATYSMQPKAPPQLVPPSRAPGYEPDTEDLPKHDREDGHAARTRMIAGATALIGAVIVAVVILSTGMFNRDRGSHASPVATMSPPAATPAGHAQTPAPRAGSAPTSRASVSSFGLQVASFRTAGRAARVLNDMKNLTRLPGEILTTEDPDGNTWFRIVLGRFASETEARNAAQDLVGRSLIPEAIVIPFTPRTP